MAELVPDDLPEVIRDRFDDDDAAQAGIDAALAAARRYCGWYVSPLQTAVEMDVDGPGGRVLSLPTLNLIAVTAVVEDGIALDVTKLDVSRRKGTVEKHPYGCWTSRSGGIVATVTHGYTEAEAADWRSAVVELVGERSKIPGSQRDGPMMASKKVDDVEYQWFATLISSDQLLAAKFSTFRILQSP